MHSILRSAPTAALLSVAVLASSASAQSNATRPTLSESVRAYVTVDSPVVALTNVRVVDGTGVPAADNQTIVIENGVIRTVGATASTRPPRGAQVIDLTGHTVTPGFVGMHNHTWYTTSNRATQLPFSAPRLYLGSGVTTIRTTGSLSPYVELNMKKAIDEGELVGPRMHVTGPYITAKGTSLRMYGIEGPEDARRAVAYWATEGATWIKVYTRITREEFAAVVDEAHKHGIKVTGHLCSIGFREAVELGIDNLEHGLFVNTEYDPAKEPDRCPPDAMLKLRELDLQSADVQRTFSELIEAGIPITSTLAVYELFVPNRPPVEARTLRAMSGEVREEYLETRARIAEREGFGIPLDIFKKAQAYEVAFVRAGGLLAAGVDPTGNGGALPGFGDQRNYELLIEAGFTPIEAIQIMTSNGAKVLGEYDTYGSIEPGKRADLVVFEGDPIGNPADIRRVVTVFRDGIGYDAAKLIDDVEGQVGIR